MGEYPKILVIYYSRTGNTAKIALKIAEILNADVEKIIDKTNRSGLWGYLKSGYQAARKRLTDIAEPEHNPAHYDLIIIGTPVWAWTISAPVRTYIYHYWKQFPKNIAFFATMGGSGDEKTFHNMQNIIGISPINTLSVKQNEISAQTTDSKIHNFCQDLLEKLHPKQPNNEHK
ncbi:flavodoxin [bacterium]|nr:MAG: flavodoxin [bacterium]